MRGDAWNDQQGDVWSDRQVRQLFEAYMVMLRIMFIDPFRWSPETDDWRARWVGWFGHADWLNYIRGHFCEVATSSCNAPFRPARSAIALLPLHRWRVCWTGWLHHADWCRSTRCYSCSGVVVSTNNAPTRRKNKFSGRRRIPEQCKSSSLSKSVLSSPSAGVREIGNVLSPAPFAYSGQLLGNC